jgi:hypothetical protein
MSMQWYPAYGAPNPTFDALNSMKWRVDEEPHYILRNNEGLLTGGYDALKDKTLTITVELKTQEVFDPTKAIWLKSTECEDWQDKTARAALLLRRSTNLSNEFDRAWFGVRPKMILGQLSNDVTTFQIAAPLEGPGWGFVYTKGYAQAPDKWRQMLGSVKDIGLTFNGCSSAGHGATLKNGKIRFTITSVTVQ